MNIGKIFVNVNNTFDLPENVSVAIDLRDVKTGEITENYVEQVLPAAKYTLLQMLEAILGFINSRETIYLIRDNYIMPRNNTIPDIRLRTSKPIGITKRGEFVRNLYMKRYRQEKISNIAILLPSHIMYYDILCTPLYNHISRTN